MARVAASLCDKSSNYAGEPFPQGESYRQVVDRMRTFLDDLARDWNDNHVLVIGHAATRFALQHLLEGQRLEDVVNATFDWQPGLALPAGLSPS